MTDCFLKHPKLLLTVAHSISFGWKHTLSTVAGATMGTAVQLIVAAIGLTSLLNVVAEAFEWLRWVGAAYLVYLGIKQFCLSTNIIGVLNCSLLFQVGSG